jgi:ATP-binding cassette subfamily F protein uup
MAPPLLALRDATAGLGDERLFRQVSVQVEAGARICLVGRNGSGKSTLLRALAGEVELDAGDRFVQPGVTVAYLPQEPRHDGACSASDVVAGGLPADIGPAEGRHLAHAMLERLSVPPDAVLATLSGGEARRVAIGRRLISAADILLLDEPTNHLDIEMILRLEADLERLRAAIVLVSHDRAFLNALSRTTWWLDRGRLLQQERGYAEFDRWSDEVLAAEEEARAKLDRQIALETHWSHHGITARRKRNQGRLRRLGELRQARARRPAPEGRVNLPTMAGGQGAKLIVEASAISKGFHAGPLVDRFSTRILRGDRIGLVGPNGAGKTTLLRLLTGQLQPDAGEVRLAHDLEVAFVDQRRESLDPDATPWSTLCPAGGDHVMVQGRARHVVTYLKDFLFRPEQARAPLRSLSGGERNRLVLAKQLARPVDLMVLDEPTNDLDLDTTDLELPPRHRRKAIAAARRMENGSNRLVPRFRDIHPMIAEGPEECTFALPHALMPLSQARIPEYQAWHLKRDFLPDYRYLKQIFQVLQYGRPRRRWILKSPMHLEHLDVLPTVFPDATLVWTHRDPVTAVASLCSLVETGMGISVNSVDLHAIGAIWLELLSRSMTRALEARSAICPDALVDVPYSWLGTAPHTGAPKLYEAIGAHWTDYEASRLDGVVARPAGTRPHTYDLSRYGLTRTHVETAFAHYNALRADVDGP